MTDDMKRISRFKHQTATAVLIAFLALGGCQPDSGSSVIDSVNHITDSPDSISSAPRMHSYPGHYQGYSEEKYNGYELASRYIPMRDGTQIAIDVFRPTDAGTFSCTSQFESCVSHEL